MLNVALDGVRAFDILSRVTSGVSESLIWEPVGLELNKHNQSLSSCHQQLPEKLSEMGIGGAAAFQWEKRLFVPAEMLCSSFQTLTAA